MFRKIVSVLIAASVFISLAACSFPSVLKKPVKEQQVKELADIVDYTEEEKRGLSVDLYCFDGAAVTRYRSHIKFHEKDQYYNDIEEMKKLVRKTASRKGILADDFTSDKITYPVYSFSVQPLMFSVNDDVYTRRIVWTNGYLINDSGDVYKCEMDFSPITKSEELFEISEYENEDLMEWIGTFRPLAMANNKWDTGFLVPADADDSKTAPDIKGKVINRYEKNGYDWVTIEFENWSDKDWNYSDYCELNLHVKGRLYSIPRDSNRIHYTIGASTSLCQNMVLKRSTTTKDYCLGVYGYLVPGKYVIAVPAECGNAGSQIYVDYTV